MDFFFFEDQTRNGPGAYMQRMNAIRGIDTLPSSCKKNSIADIVRIQYKCEI